MRVIKMGEVPKLPDTFCCPICGDKLTLEIEEWTEDYDGWKASETGLTLSCATEPDITDDDYDEWLDGHFRMPYVDWMPVDAKVYAWLEDNYRFERN